FRSISTDCRRTWTRSMRLRPDTTWPFWKMPAKRMAPDIKVFARERLPTLQAAILRAKLQYLDGWNVMRELHAQGYHDLLSGSSVTLPRRFKSIESSWHLYVVRSPFRDLMKQHLEAHGITAGLHYPTPIHLQPAYADAGYRRGDFPIAERLSDESLSLPMYAELDRGSLERVADAVMSTPGVKHASFSVLLPWRGPETELRAV